MLAFAADLDRLIGLVPRSQLSGSDHGSPISALADKALIDEPHIQLSLLNADFPFSLGDRKARRNFCTSLCRATSPLSQLLLDFLE